MTNMFYKAFCGGSNEIYLVKDNKIISTAKWAFTKDGMVSVYFTDDSIVSKYVKNLDGTEPRHAYFTYSIYDGFFITSMFDHVEEIDDFFADTRIVDSFNLRWGMVPDTFKDVEGYRCQLVKNTS